MDDLEEKLNKLLNDPTEMERFAGFAKSFMSGGDEKDKSPMLPKLPSGGRDERLLEAMRPFLSEKRRVKMDRAMKIARLARLAQIANDKLGDGDGV